MNNFLDDIEKWKIKKSNERIIKQEKTPAFFPFLFYTEYICPFFIFYFVNRKPYLYNPHFSEVLQYSALIEYYLEKFNVLFNPKPTLFDSVRLYQYLQHINPAEKFKSVTKVFEFTKSGCRVKQIETKNNDSHIDKIVSIQKRILKNEFETEYKLITHLQNESLLNEYYYFCENHCPYFHICRVKDKL
jgi:hypothetical protein